MNEGGVKPLMTQGFFAVTAPIIFDKIHFLLISENEFFHEIKCNGMTSFLEFMMYSSVHLTKSGF